MNTGNPKSKPNDRRKRARATDSKTPSVNDEVRRQFRSEHLDRCGFYQQPRRYRNVDPLDQLLGPDGEETKDAEDRKPDEPSEED
jgi:hypothetical protein